MKCKTGAWLDTLDSADVKAFSKASISMKRVDLHRAITTVHSRVFSLTVLKDHLNQNCVCTMEGKHG